MQEVTKDQFIRNIDDCEKIHLIFTEFDKVWLRADIENEEVVRIEMMYFELNTSLNFSDADSECRCKYCGNIYFIKCGEDEVTDILSKYPNKSIFVAIL